MADAPPENTSGVPRLTVSCPACGSPVTADSSQEGDKGRVFRCPNCAKLFGIVPGISEPIDVEDATESTPGAS
jgi:predicted Zn finger-like uncharacterized protein